MRSRARSMGRPHVHRLAVYGLCALAISAACGLYYRAEWPSYEAFDQAIDARCKVPYFDFTHFYVPQAGMLRAQDTPVHGYFYSPTFALLLTPLVSLPRVEAWEIWTWVQAVSLLLLLSMSALALRAFPAWTHALALALTLTSYPILHNWAWGQINTGVVALALLALLLFERHAPLRAALVLASVTALRYYPALYAVGLLSRRRPQPLVWFALSTCALLFALPAAFLGANHTLRFYRNSSASIDLAMRTWLVGDRASEYLPNAIARFEHVQHLQLGSHALWVAISAALAALNLAAVIWTAHKPIAQRPLWAFSLLALSTPLLFTTSWMHYFVYLPLVQSFLAAQLAHVQGHMRLKLAGFLLLWAPSVVLSNVLFFQHVGGCRHYERQAYLLWSDLTLMALALPLLWASLARQSTRSTSDCQMRPRSA